MCGQMQAAVACPGRIGSDSSFVDSSLTRRRLASDRSNSQAFLGSVVQRSASTPLFSTTTPTQPPALARAAPSAVPAPQPRPTQRGPWEGWLRAKNLFLKGWGGAGTPALPALAACTAHCTSRAASRHVKSLLRAVPIKGWPRRARVLKARLGDMTWPYRTRAAGSTLIACVAAGGWPTYLWSGC